MISGRARLSEPLVLLTLAVACVGFAGWRLLFFLFVILGAALAIRALLRLVRRPTEISIFHVLATSVLLGYFFGPAVSILYWHFGDQTDPERLAGPFAYRGYTPAFSLAITAAYLSVAALTFADQHTLPLARLQRVQGRSASSVDRLFLTAMAFIVVAALAFGEIGYMGTTVSGADTVTVLGSLAALVLPGLVPVLLVSLLAPQQVKAHRAFFLILVLPLLAVLALQGRRVLIFTAVVALFLLAYRDPRWRNRLQLRRLLARPREIAYIALLGALVLAGMYFFYAVRLAVNQNGATAPLSAQVDTAIHIIRGDRKAFYSTATEQGQARSGTLPGYLGGLLDSPVDRHMNGLCLYASLLKATPRVLLPDKQLLTSQYSCSDEAVNHIYGLPETDSPTTLLTQGYADFGWLGIVLYPLLAGGLIQLSLRYLRLPSVPVVSELFVSIFVFTGIFVEQSTDFYLVTVRNLVFILGIGYITLGLKELLRKRSYVH